MFSVPENVSFPPPNSASARRGRARARTAAAAGSTASSRPVRAKPSKTPRARRESQTCLTKIVRKRRAHSVWKFSSQNFKSRDPVQGRRGAADQGVSSISAKLQKLATSGLRAPEKFVSRDRHGLGLVVLEEQPPSPSRMLDSQERRPKLGDDGGVSAARLDAIRVLLAEIHEREAFPRIQKIGHENAARTRARPRERDRLVLLRASRSRFQKERGPVSPPSPSERT